MKRVLTWLLAASLCCMGLAPSSKISSINKLLEDESFKDGPELLSALQALERARASHAEGNIASVKQWYGRARVILTRLLKENRKKKPGEQYYKALEVLKFDLEYRLMHEELWQAAKDLGMDLAKLPQPLQYAPGIKVLNREVQDIVERMKEDITQGTNGIAALKEKSDKAKNQYEALLALIPEAETMSSEMMDDLIHVKEMAHKTQLQEEVAAIAADVDRIEKDLEGFVQRLREIQLSSVAVLQQADQIPAFPMPLGAWDAIQEEILDIHLIKDKGSLEGLLKRIEEKTEYRNIRGVIEEKIDELQAALLTLQAKYKQYDDMFGKLHAAKLSLEQEKPLEIMQGHHSARKAGIDEKRPAMEKARDDMLAALKRQGEDIPLLMRHYATLLQTRSAFLGELKQITENKKYQPQVEGIVDVKPTQVANFKKLMQQAPSVRRQVVKLREDLAGLDEASVKLDRAMAQAAGLGLEGTDHAHAWELWYRSQREEMARKSREDRKAGTEVPGQKVADYFAEVLRRSEEYMGKFPAMLEGLHILHQGHQESLKDLESVQETLSLAGMNMEELEREALLKNRLKEWFERKERLDKIRQRRADDLPGHINEAILHGKKTGHWTASWREIYAALRQEADQLLGETDGIVKNWRFVKPLITAMELKLAKLEEVSRKVKNLKEDAFVGTRLAREAFVEKDDAVRSGARYQEAGKQWRSLLERMREKLLGRSPDLDATFVEDRQGLLDIVEQATKAAEVFIGRYGPMHELLSQDNGAIRKLIREAERRVGALAVVENQIGQEWQGIEDAPGDLSQRYQTFAARAGAAKARLGGLIDNLWMHARSLEALNGAKNSMKQQFREHQGEMDNLQLEGATLLGELKLHKNEMQRLAKTRHPALTPPAHDRVADVGQPAATSAEKIQLKSKLKDKAEYLLQSAGKVKGAKTVMDKFLQSDAELEDLLLRLESRGAPLLSLNGAEINELKGMLRQIQAGTLKPKELKKAVGIENPRHFAFALHRLLSPQRVLDVYASRSDNDALKNAALAINAELGEIREARTRDGMGDANPQVLLLNVLPDTRVADFMGAQARQDIGRGLQQIGVFLQTRIKRGGIMPVTKADFAKMTSEVAAAMAAWNTFLNDARAKIQKRDREVQAGDTHAKAEFEANEPFWKYVEPALVGCSLQTETLWKDATDLDYMNHFLMSHAVDMALDALSKGQPEQAARYLRTHYGLIPETSRRTTQDLVKRRLEEAAVLTPDIIPIMLLDAPEKFIFRKDVLNSVEAVPEEDLSLKDRVLAGRQAVSGLKEQESQLLFGRILIEMLLEYWLVNMLDLPNEEISHVVRDIAEQLQWEDIQEISGVYAARIRDDKAHSALIVWLLQNKEKVPDRSLLKKLLPDKATFLAFLLQEAFALSKNPYLDVPELKANPAAILAMQNMLIMDFMQEFEPAERMKLFQAMQEVQGVTYNMSVMQEHAKMIDLPQEHRILATAWSARAKAHMDNYQRILTGIAQKYQQPSEMPAAISTLALWAMLQTVPADEAWWVLEHLGQSGKITPIFPDFGQGTLEEWRDKPQEKILSETAKALKLPVPLLEQEWQDFAQKNKTLFEKFAVIGAFSKESLLNAWAAFQLKLAPWTLYNDRPRWEQIAGDESDGKTDAETEAQRRLAAAL